MEQRREEEEGKATIRIVPRPRVPRGLTTFIDRRIDLSVALNDRINL